MIKKLFASAFLKTFAFAILISFFSSCQRQNQKVNQLSKVRTFFTFSQKIGDPFGLAVKNGVIFVSDGETGKIFQIAKDGSSSLLTEETGTPSHIAFDKNENLIVADSGTHTIKKIKPTGEVETLAGTENQAGFRDGEAGSALFHAPIGVAVKDNKIFVSDTYNDKIRVIENGMVTTLAGSVPGFADSENGLLAKFNTPCGIALTKNGNLLVADANNRRLRVVEPNGKTWTLLGRDSAGLVDGTLAEASLLQPTAVAVEQSGKIYFADGNAIRVVENQLFPIVKTISNDRHGFVDGRVDTARFNRPSGLTFDEKGNLFVADSENQAVRVFTGEEIGQELTPDLIEKMRFSPEEFRQTGKPAWPYHPPEKVREIAGTFGEIRGEISETNEPAYFHNGLDIVGYNGERAHFIRTEKVLRPIAVENFATLRELLRMPTLNYVHINLGRDKDNRPFGDKRFLFSTGENGKLNAVRVPRGAKFEAGEVLGTLNPMNHVHLIVGRSGAEINALEALVLPGISDKIPPSIEKITLFDENWQTLETDRDNLRIKLNGKTRIVAKAYDRMDGNAERRRLGVFKIGFQILKEDGTPLGEIKWTIRFNRLPDHEAVRLVYASGSKSGATGATVFNYIVSNEFDGKIVKENFFDASKLEKGNYILRILAGDYFGNISTKDVQFQVW